MVKIYNRANLYWKDKLTKDTNDLYHKSTKLVSYEPDAIHAKMYRVLWPDGELSYDIYNKTRIIEHCYRIALRKLNPPSNL